MKKLTVKDTEQRMAFRDYINNKYVGSIIAGTGFGKTRVGVECGSELSPRGCGLGTATVHPERHYFSLAENS